MPATDIAIVAAAISLASMVFMIAGFGFSLLAMPLLVLVVPVSDALVIMALLGLGSVVWQGIALRADRDRTLVRRLAITTYLGMPVGLVVLNVADDRSLRLAVGVGVCVATVVLASGLSLPTAGPSLDWGLGALSGVLSTSIGVNGPPLILDLQARGLSPERTRATIAAVFALASPVGLALFVADGRVTREGLIASAIALPGWALGSLAGRAIRPHVAPERFRRLVLGLLGLSGSLAIATAIT
ncbi:sulfite exporter TauE/SafE family protein [Ilumatobacter sp.]|uniref:sulfite exporter TauE/SafE family protein n=1 Tax=Ilumatobacter sp. TaxID=1967498 RepID=UPI003B52A612